MRTQAAKQEAIMTRVRSILTVAAAMMIAGLFILKADATPLTSAANAPALTGAHSAVEPVGCMFGTRRCPAGTKWICTHYPAAAGKSKKCVCRAC
jgi:hypothetical protein